jgi:hypothetical protein
MTVARFAISFDEKLAREVRRAAGEQSTSAWFADAARRKLRSEGLLKVIAEWEVAHGKVDEAELAVARAKQRKSTKR